MIFVQILTYIGIGLILSIDAFFACVALAIDKGKNKKALMMTPFFIGVMHTLFPIIAALLVYFVFQGMNIHGLENYTRWISGGIFFLLGIWSIFKKEEENENIIVTLMSVFVLSLSVSIDSILIGLSYGFEFISNPQQLYTIYIAAPTFGIISSSIAFLSIKLGRKIIDKIQNVKFNLISGIFFILLAILTFFNVL